MTTQTDIKATLDAISRDSRISDDPTVVAAALVGLYGDHMDELHTAIVDLFDDVEWSYDAQPYGWLRGVSRAINAIAAGA